MKLPIACVRGLEAAPAYHCPSHRREERNDWDRMGNQGKYWDQISDILLGAGFKPSILWPNGAPEFNL